MSGRENAGRQGEYAGDIGMGKECRETAWEKDEEKVESDCWG